MMSPRDQAAISNLIQGAIGSLVSKLEAKVDKLDEKVDLISQSHASRADLEKLRRDIQASYVPRDAYEARHAALIARDAQIEGDLKQLGSETQADFQRFHERLESGKQQIEDRLRLQSEATDKKLNEQKNATLSDQDRRWLRGSQIFGVAAVVIAVLDLIIQHVHFS